MKPWITALFGLLLACGGYALTFRDPPGLSLTSGNSSYVVTLRMPDPRAGMVDVLLTVHDRRPAGAALPGGVTVQAIEPTLGHASPVVSAAADTPTDWTAAGVHLMSPGRWRLIVTVTGSDPILFPVPVTG